MDTTNSDANQILSAVKEIVPAINEYRDEIEKSRRQPLALIEGLKRTGVFRMTMPAALGGAELDILSQTEILEVLAKANASVGWCVKIGTDNGYFSSFLRNDVAESLLGHNSPIVGSAVAPSGKAERVNGGYRLSGRWFFSSGCQHTSLLVAGCKVYKNGTLQLGEGGVPETRQCFVPTEAVNILDTWHAMGLKGTGSNDFTLDDLFVPEEHTFSFQQPKIHREGNLYRFPSAFRLNFPSVPIGVALSAIDALTEVGSNPCHQYISEGTLLAPGQLRDEPQVQEAAGKAFALIGAAKAYYRNTVFDLCKSIEADIPFTAEQQAQYQSLSAQVVNMCVDAVKLVFNARGASAIYTGSTLDACMRDMLTINQHVMNSNRTFYQSGRLLMGLSGKTILN